MSAVLDCLQRRGIQTQENSMTSDAAVIWSVLWHGRMSANRQVYEHYRAQGKPVIIIEIGALYRGNTWKISVNNITSHGYYGHLDNLDWDRPTKLNISLATQLVSKPNVIIAVQHDRSLQVAGVNMSDWVKNTISTLRNNTDRPITIRPHPRCRLMLNNLPSGVSIESPKKLANSYDSYDMHFDCHAVVNYNSGPGITTPPRASPDGVSTNKTNPTSRGGNTRVLDRQSAPGQSCKCGDPGADRCSPSRSDQSARGWSR